MLNGWAKAGTSDGGGRVVGSEEGGNLSNEIGSALNFTATAEVVMVLISRTGSLRAITRPGAIFEQGDLQEA